MSVLYKDALVLKLHQEKMDNKEMDNGINKKHLKYYAIKYLLFYLIFSVLSFFAFLIIILIRYIYEFFLLHYIALFIHNYFNYPRTVAIAISVMAYFLLFALIFMSYKISMKFVHKIMQNEQ